MDITVNFKGGGSFVFLRPIFSANGENVFVSSKNSVLEYNTKTGKLIHEYKGMVNNIIGFSCHTYERFSCLTACSKTGEIIVWKTITHFAIFKTKITKRKIRTFHIIPSDDDRKLIALVSCVSKKHIQFSVIDIKNKSCNHINIKLDMDKYFVDTSGSNYFSVVQKNTIYFVSLKNLEKVTRNNIAQSNRIFTCIACHPIEEIVLTGDNTGRVVIWQNIFSKEKPQAVFHWHTLPVNCVGFSSAGSYFYSGGDECVLVKWQCDNPEEKSFLPRLRAGIQHISVSNNNAVVAVATADNAILILNPQMEQISLIQHLVLGKHLKSGLNYDPRSEALVLNGTVGCVQFYSPNDMSLLYSVDVVGHNKITNERNHKIENLEVIKLAISKSGLWLATVEERIDKEYSNEIRLKFYHFYSTKQSFDLNTVIEYPHEKSVESIAFQPLDDQSNLRCVTVGEDKKFKIWQLLEISSVYRKGVAWQCSGVAFYRDLDCKALSFSVDGSLIATGFESILTVWTPDSCELKCSLVHPSHKEVIKFVQFGYGTQCHLIAAASVNQLSVWNLLSLRMIWTVHLDKITLLVPDRLSTNIAVLTEANKVFIFELASPKPIYANNGLLEEQSRIVAGTFIPNKYRNDTRLKWYERSNFYFITCDSELFCISKNENVAEYEYEEITENANNSIFSMMMPALKNNKSETVTPKIHLYEKDIRHKSIKKYLEAPLQTMVPIRFTCQSLLKSLVLQKEAAAE